MHTYIGNDRKLADSTENVVPNSWRQHVHEKRQIGKGKRVHVFMLMLVYLCKGKEMEGEKEVR